MLSPSDTCKPVGSLSSSGRSLGVTANRAGMRFTCRSDPENFGSPITDWGSHSRRYNVPTGTIAALPVVESRGVAQPFLLSCVFGRCRVAYELHQPRAVAICRNVVRISRGETRRTRLSLHRQCKIGGNVRRYTHIPTWRSHLLLRVPPPSRSETKRAR